MLEHGGRLRAAAARWGIPLADWVDLSTGIAPWSYPAHITAAAWQRLPEDDDGLDAAAARYYGHPAPLALPGSQAAIQLLPRLISAARVALTAPTYGEYAPAWRAAGHWVFEHAYKAVAAGEIEAEVVMLASPNNPTGERLDLALVHKLAAVQERRGGWLIVDAAFADAEPDGALAPLAGETLPRLVVLHSLGKFFGLAGARVGFFCGAPELRLRLAKAIGPWAVAHPSRQAAAQALADADWHAAQRARLAAATTRLLDLLAGHGIAGAAGGSLFVYAPYAEAKALEEFLARRAVLVRRFAQPAALRFGLPGGKADWRRLEAALAEWTAVPRE